MGGSAMMDRFPMIPDPVFVLCLRFAGLRMLLETEGRPVSMVVNIERLFAEAMAIYQDTTPKGY